MTTGRFVQTYCYCLAVMSLGFGLGVLTLETPVEAQQYSEFHFTDTILSTEVLPLSRDIIVGDVNADQVLDMDDVTYILGYLFAEGPAPLPERYRSVRQAYVREWYGTAVVDSEGDTLLSLPKPHDYNDIYYILQSEGAVR